MTSRTRHLVLAATSVLTLTSAAHAAPPLYSPVIYLNRCTGGCTINPGPENALTMSWGVSSTTQIPEFVDAAGNSGAAADAEWNALVACVAETFSPYAVTVTDQKPAAGTEYNLAIVAGSGTNLGLPSTVFSISSSPHCDGGANFVSFTFPAAVAAGSQRIPGLCGNIANAVAVAFGLDHVLAYPSGRQACTDPLAWNSGACGGQRYFRDDFATCGETTARSCICNRSSVNTHRLLLAAFGPGQSTTPPPTSTVTVPVAGGVLGGIVAAAAGSRRGVDKVELWINGHKWAETKGAMFLANGQLDPSSYTLTVPAGVPDSVVDIVARACDDLGTCTDSDVVTATKGAEGGCTSASTCLAGQKCEAGKCFWDPPSGELGASCTYNEFCLSGTCGTNGDQQACTQSCLVSAADSCPPTFSCIAETGDQGFCYPPAVADDAGCCSANGGTGSVLLALALGLPLGARRRRRGTAGQSRGTRLTGLAAR